MNEKFKIFIIFFCFLIKIQILCGFNLENIKFSKYNNAYDIYDFIFPILLRNTIIKDNFSNQQKVITTIKFVNFYSTPGRYKDFNGLGTGAPWWRNSSLMLSSGNLLCSEQSSLATLILKPDFKFFALRDVTNHTFHEVKIGERWEIIDPLYDNRILDNKNLLVTFNEIQDYLNGNKKILKLPLNPSTRTKKYLSLFKKETYKPVRMKFGQHIVFRPENINRFIGIPVDSFIKILKKYNFDINKKLCYPYLAYIRNNINYILSKSKNRKKLINTIQDFFFSKFSKQLIKGWISSDVDILYEARNYQFLGRFNKALKIYTDLPQTEQILFYKSQIYFKLKDTKNFNMLKDKLRKNIYYRYMYWLLNKKFLNKGDSKAFDKFPFKLVDYDKLLISGGE